MKRLERQFVPTLSEEYWQADDISHRILGTNQILSVEPKLQKRRYLIAGMYDHAPTMPADGIGAFKFSSYVDPPETGKVLIDSRAILRRGDATVWNIDRRRVFRRADANSLSHKLRVQLAGVFPALAGDRVVVLMDCYFATNQHANSVVVDGDDPRSGGGTNAQLHYIDPGPQALLFT